MTRTLLAGAALAAVATGASAATGVVVREYSYTQPPAYIVGGPPVVAYDSREYDPTYHHRHCRAPVWDPNTRYMPGDAVVRKGELYVARGISERVYNVNSPPEWTPNYWRPAHC